MSSYLGQNFLIDKNIVAKIVKAGDIKKNDIILEIGPGKGILTQALLKKAKKVIAVELDQKLAQNLRCQMPNPKLKIINKNILEISKSEIRNCHKIIASIPYYITGRILKKFAGYYLVLLVQKEVAQRICAKRKQSVLSISVNSWGRPKIISQVSQNCFRPVPQVDSAILKIIPRLKPLKINMNLVKKAFGQKRKKLRNTLNINSDRRPEDLSLKNWVKISQNYQQDTATLIC